MYQAPTFDTLPSGSSQLAATLAGLIAPIRTTCSAAYRADPITIATRIALAKSRLGLAASPAS